MDKSLVKAIRKIIALFEKDLSLQVEGFIIPVPDRNLHYVCAHGRRGCSFLYAVDLCEKKVQGKHLLVGSSSIH